MKHNTRISTVSILCVLCMCAAGSAYGAASVRSLGGSGTISGTSAATGATTSGTATGAGVSRAGSVRVTPTSAKTSTSASVSSGNTSAARNAATSRLSVGKYLNKVVTNNSNKLGQNVSSSSSASNTTVISGEVTKIVDALQGNVDKLQGEIQSLRDDSHRAPVAGSFVEISDDNEISINVTELANALSDKLNVDAGTIDITLTGSDDDKYISFCQSSPDSECKYQEIIAVSELRGPKGDKGDPVSMEDLSLLLPQLEQVLDQKIATAVANIDLSGYVTTEALTEALAGKQDALTDEQMAVLDSGITAEGVAQIGLNTANITANTTAISQKANAADVYTTTEIDSKLEGITAGAVAPAPDSNDYVWVSMGGEQQWVSVAGAVSNE